MRGETPPTLLSQKQSTSVCSTGAFISVSLFKKKRYSPDAWRMPVLLPPAKPKLRSQAIILRSGYALRSCSTSSPCDALSTIINS